MNDHGRKRIKLVETCKIFNSIQEAANYIGGERSSIGQAAGYKHKTSAGYHWEFVDQKDIEKRQKRVEKDTWKPYSWSKKVVCLETGKIYNSMKEAAEKIFIHPAAITYAAKDPLKRTAGGYHWKCIGDRGYVWTD